jgi:CTD small phosphatase-like protein 2
MVYTAGTKDYADAILDTIDPEKTIFRARLYRHNCTKLNGYYLKDLSQISKRLSINMNRIVLVDNSIISFALHPSNGVPIPDFFGKIDQDSDQELVYAAEYLDELFELKAEDMLPKLKEDFKLEKMLANDTKRRSC